MIVKITMKDPDGFSESLSDAIDGSLVELSDQDEQEALREVRHEEVKKVLEKWFKYDEYISLEIDTDKETITVLPA